MVARRKQMGPGRSSDAVNKENEANCMQDVQQEVSDTDHWDLHVNVTNEHRAGEIGFEQDDCCTLTEVRHILTVQSDIVF